MNKKNIKTRNWAVALLMFAAASLNAQQKPLEEIDFEYEGGHIVVEASVDNGTPLKFVFDTGAGGVAAIEQNLDQAGKLKIAQEVPVMGGNGETRTMKLSAPVPVKIGTLDFAAAPFVLTDLQAFRDRGFGFDGILGSRQIEDYVMEIDYEQQKLRFYDKGSFEYEGEGTVLPIQRDRGIPNVEVTIKAYGNEIKGRAVVDTGAALAMGLNTHVVNKHEMLADDSRRKLRFEALGASGTFDSYLTRIETISFGGYDFEQVPGQLNTVESGPLANPNFVALIGNHIMRKFNVILDYSRQRMIIEPNARFNEVFPVNSTGIRHGFTLTENQGFAVNNVFDDSPASRLGIKAGDELLTVAGKKVADYSFDELYDLLNNAGPAIQVTWISNGKSSEGRLERQNVI